MSNIIRDKLHVNGLEYAIDGYPLDAWLACLPERPALVPTPWRQNGYVATWTVADGALYLWQVSREPLARLYAQAYGAAPAVWFSGLIHGMRGEHRHTGYPPRKFFEDEIVLEVVAGVVAREWVLDLRAVPDQTDEELRLSLPRFLWPARLRGD